jgi:cysteine synthase
MTRTLRDLTGPEIKGVVPDFLNSIGRTPLGQLNRVARDVPAGVSIYAKAEHLNPGGSVKDRAARDDSSGRE